MKYPKNTLDIRELNRSSRDETPAIPLGAAAKLSPSVEKLELIPSLLSADIPVYARVRDMAHRPRVALDVETSLVYGRQILQGVSRYLRANRPWSIYLEQHELGSDLPGLLKRWTGDGIITRQATPESAKLLKQWRLAAIDLSDIHPHLGILRISSADLAIGRMAAEHLLERGFQSFACAGFSAEDWSRRRREGFIGEVGHADHAVRFDPQRAARGVGDERLLLAEGAAVEPHGVNVPASHDGGGLAQPIGLGLIERNFEGPGARVLERQPTRFADAADEIVVEVEAAAPEVEKRARIMAFDEGRQHAG